MGSINDRLYDFQVAQQIRWIRLQNKEAREALRILSRVDEELSRLLQGADISSGTFTQKRLRALKTQVRNLMSAVHDQLAKKVTEAVIDAAELSAETEAKILGKMVAPAGLDVTTPNLGVLQKAATLRPFNGAVLADWAKQLKNSDIQRTWTAILDGITMGETTDDLIRRVIGSKSLRYKDGVREVSRRGAETFVRTSINHATNQGRQMVWEANADILKGVQWVSTLDTRTTPICRERDGKVGPVVDDPNWTPPSGRAPLDPPFARPPAHPNCRSTTVAITKSWKELGLNGKELPEGTRASMNGQVPASTTYYEWLRKQPADIQEEVLGPTRLKLWKEQGIKPEKFVNDKGQLLTLDQLRAKQDLPKKAATPSYVERIDSLKPLPGTEAVRSPIVTASPKKLAAFSFDELEAARYNLNLPTQRVEISAVKTLNPHINPQLAKQLAESSKDTLLPLVAKVGDDLVLLEGDHRFVAEWAKGNKTVETRVLDLTKDLEVIRATDEILGTEWTQTNELLHKFLSKEPDAQDLVKGKAGNSSIELVKIEDLEKSPLGFIDKSKVNKKLVRDIALGREKKPPIPVVYETPSGMAILANPETILAHRIKGDASLEVKVYRPSFLGNPATAKVDLAVLRKLEDYRVQDSYYVPVKLGAPSDFSGLDKLPKDVLDGTNELKKTSYLTLDEVTILDSSPVKFDEILSAVENKSNHPVVIKTKEGLVVVSNRANAIYRGLRDVEFQAIVYDQDELVRIVTKERRGTKPLSLKKSPDNRVDDELHAEVKAAGARGHQVETDSLDIEDHDLTVHIETGADGKQRTVATFKVNPSVGAKIDARPEFEETTWQIYRSEFKQNTVERTTEVAGEFSEVLAARTTRVNVVKVKDTHNLSALRNLVRIEVEGGDKDAMQKIFDVVHTLGIKTRLPTASEKLLKHLLSVSTRNPTILREWEDWVSRNPNASVTLRLEELKKMTRKHDPKAYFSSIKEYRDHSGRVRAYRPDLLKDPKWKDFERNYVLIHDFSYAGAVRPAEIVGRILDTGGSLVSLTERIRLGIRSAAASFQKDLETGGGDYVFTRIREKRTAAGMRNVFVWKAKAAARSDAIHYSGDKYGYTRDRHFIARESGKTVSDLMSMSQYASNETIFKRGLSLFQDLEAIQVSGDAARAAVIKAFHDRGIKRLPDGRKVEDVIVAV